MNTHGDRMATVSMNYESGLQVESANPIRKSGKPRACALLTLSTLLLSSCGTASTITSGAQSASTSNISNHRPASDSIQSQQPVGSGYLAVLTNEVDFIQWTNTNGEFNGTMQVVTNTTSNNFFGNSHSTKTTSQTLSITGSIHGKQLSISINFGSTLFGTFSGNSFVVNFPQSDGTLAPMTFTKTTTAAFNNAVNELKNEAQAANVAASAQQALQNEESKISSDARAVDSIINSDLPSDESNLASDVASVPTTLKKLNTDLATTKSEEQKVSGEVGKTDPSYVCDDASYVADDASYVADDLSSITSDLSSLRNNESLLQSAFSEFQSAAANLPSFSAVNAPTQAEVTSALKTASTDTSTAVSKVNSFIDQANAGVASAYEYASQAYSIGNCGQPPRAPKPLAHIS